MIIVIIFVVNIAYVSLSTIRMILTLKGRRYLAASVSLLEVMMYIIGLSLVLDNLDAIQNVIAYAVGYAIGVVIGSIIEEKLALGYITVNVVSSFPELNFSERLRASGYGVTSWRAGGRDGDRLSMQILTPRKYEVKLYEAIKDIDERAFIISYEPKRIYGGFWVRQVRRGRLFNPRAKQEKRKAAEAAQSENQSAEQVDWLTTDDVPYVDEDLMDHTMVELEVQEGLDQLDATEDEKSEAEEREKDSKDT